MVYTPYKPDNFWLWWWSSSSPHEDQSVGMGLGEEWQAGDCGEQQLAG